MLFFFFEKKLRTQGLVEVIQKGKALVGGYLVHGRNPKRKDVEKFDEWDDLLKRQLEMLNIQSLIDGRKTAVNTEAMVPLVRDIKTTAQNTEALVQELVNRSDTEKQNQSAENEAYCAVPELPPLTVGQDFPLEELKRKMFKEGKSMIVVNAMGGSGKTTLAINFCRDPDVKGILRILKTTNMLC